MSYDILRNSLQPVITGDNLVLPTQLPFEFCLLFWVEFRLLNQIVNVIVQVRIYQLQLRCSIFVEERHRRAIFDRLLEVVDGDVIPKDLLRALLTCNERRAGKGGKHRFR